MRPPGRSSAAAVLWPAAASGSNSRWRPAPCVGARRTCVPPRKYSLARTRIRGVAPRTNPPSLFSCAPHLQPTVTGRQGRSCANNRWAIPEYQSGPKNDIEAKLCRCSMRGQIQSLVELRRRYPIRRHAFQHLARDAERFDRLKQGDASTDVALVGFRAKDAQQQYSRAPVQFVEVVIRPTHSLEGNAVDQPFDLFPLVDRE